MEKQEQKMTVKETQMVMLETMKRLHSFFKDNSLSYCLLFGTLLGAVRHKGFIPWDNDMDIGMPRPDYERFLNLIKNNKADIGNHYYYLHYTIDPNYHYNIIRVCDDRTSVTPPYIRDYPKRMGVWIDIFPLDGLPNKTTIGSIAWSIRRRFNRRLQIADIYAKRGDFSKLGNILGLISCHIFPRVKRRNKLLDKLAQKYKYENSNKIAYVLQEIFPLTHSDIEGALLVDFEDTKFYIPKNYNNFLRLVYGNYMELPPEDKRFTHDLYAKWN